MNIESGQHNLVDQLLEMIRTKDAEIKRLSDIIFDRAGFIRTESSPQLEGTVNKIRVGKLNVKDVLTRLEQSHRINKPNWAEEAEKASKELHPEEMQLLDLKNAEVPGKEA